jgi:dTDP-4-dehydrorhamnose reductase
MNILGTGLSGLVGSRVVELFSAKWNFQNLSLETGVDITNKALVTQKITDSDSPWVLHFAAATDVDGCEKEKDLGIKSRAWMVNATGYIVDACKKTHKRLLYISTDFVFDGTKPFYQEEDAPHPLCWYGVTKYEGEKRVSELGDHGLIMRIANPYRASFTLKPDFVAKILTRLKNGESIVAPNDQKFLPTFIDDIAHALVTLVQANANGIYHVVGDQALTPFEASEIIARIFGIKNAHIEGTTFEKYFEGRAPRPFQAILKHDKISKFGIHMAGFEEGLETIQHQL